LKVSKEPSIASAAAIREGKSPAEASKLAIPGVILDFLDRATVAVAGTRDAKLFPRVHRASGWRVDSDRRTMSCFFSDYFAKRVLSCVEDNGHFTLTIEEIGPHETYQFKGRYLDSSPCGQEELFTSERIRDRFTRVVSGMYGLSEEACRAYVLKPTLSVRFEVQEIYLQTPGPGAGRRLVPPPDTWSPERR
jgi:hypothetical protein